MIQIKTVTATRGYACGDCWMNHGELYPGERPRFQTMQEAKEYLKEKYGICKRVSMYRDSKKHGEGIHVGWIYSFRAEQQDRSSPTGVDKYLQQDWVSFYSVKTASPRTGEAY